MTNKTILITGSTDGIGLATARSFVELGHTVIIHGRSDDKLKNAKTSLLSSSPGAKIFAYKADLSILSDVNKLSDTLLKHHQNIDVLINNAGVFVVPQKTSADGLDTRFAVNTIAPYLLTKNLLPIINKNGRVINLSSAAQTSVLPLELSKPSVLSDNAVYAKSKLALTMWSRYVALSLKGAGPIVVAVNPKSFLGSKMVEQAYGVPGGSLQIGADVLIEAALSPEFSQANGLYFDNDIGQFTSPHPDALDKAKNKSIVEAIQNVLVMVEDQ